MTNGKFWFGLLSTLAVTAFVLLIVLGNCRMAEGHDWYPRSCCDDKHCRPVPCDEIHEVEYNYVYRDVFFSHALPSEDRQCHVCIGRSLSGRPTGYCLFIPEVTS